MAVKISDRLDMLERMYDRRHFSSKSIFLCGKEESMIIGVEESGRSCTEAGIGSEVYWSGFIRGIGDL